MPRCSMTWIPGYPFGNAAFSHKGESRQLDRAEKKVVGGDDLANRKWSRQAMLASLAQPIASGRNKRREICA
jgi:hypothetical protein